MQADHDERFHLAGGEWRVAGGDVVELFEPVVLGQFHVNELGVQASDVGEHQQLFEGGVLVHVAIPRGVGVALLFDGQTDEGDVQVD